MARPFHFCILLEIIQVHKDMHPRMFSSALLTTAKILVQPTCPLIEDWLNLSAGAHIGTLYDCLKKKYIWLWVITWRDNQDTSGVKKQYKRYSMIPVLIKQTNRNKQKDFLRPLSGDFRSQAGGSFTSKCSSRDSAHQHQEWAKMVTTSHLCTISSREQWKKKCAQTCFYEASKTLD